MKDGQKVAIFYYAEVKKIWVKVGGKVNGNHFTKFAVFVVEQTSFVPVNPIINFSDIAGHGAKNGIE
ncbi:hypothetical protein [Paenibacillus antarcticus]|uniref:hypothetical protein n=1 Tax=Paenibacillus antarcticus TaxID=253703 RepID=UPI000A49F89E|nr:hypothetical protein [Paenibacillus antarcticus]